MVDFLRSTYILYVLLLSDNTVVSGFTNDTNEVLAKYKKKKKDCYLIAISRRISLEEAQVAFLLAPKAKNKLELIDYVWTV